jgi:hypothetical protein
MGQDSDWQDNITLAMSIAGDCAVAPNPRIARAVNAVSQ